MIAAISLPVALDMIIAALLVATIVYAIVLNRKLSNLRNAKAEMEAMVTRFTKSTAQAESGIQNLKAHASETGAELDTMAARAAGLAQELSFLIERGITLASRLEDGIESARAHPKSAAGTTRSAAKTTPMSPAEPSPAEVALLKSLRGVR